MTTVLVFEKDALIEETPDLEHHIHTALAYHTEPDFLGSAFIPDEGEIDIDHLRDVLHQANTLTF